MTAVLGRGSKVERTLFLVLAAKFDIDKAAAGKQIDRIAESVSSYGSLASAYGVKVPVSVRLFEMMMNCEKALLEQQLLRLHQAGPLRSFERRFLSGKSKADGISDLEKPVCSEEKCQQTRKSESVIDADNCRAPFPGLSASNGEELPGPGMNL